MIAFSSKCCHPMQRTNQPEYSVGMRYTSGGASGESPPRWSKIVKSVGALPVADEVAPNAHGGDS